MWTFDHHTLMLDSNLFQHDNDPKQKQSSIKAGVEQLEQPAQSPRP